MLARTSKPRPVEAGIISRIEALPAAVMGEFEVSDKEARRIRAFLYSINKDQIRRYRTQREGSLLLVWRIK